MKNAFAKAESLYKKAMARKLSGKDIETIVKWPDEELPLLLAVSDRIRREMHRNKVSVCTIMNVKSGGCSEDCAFCTQSRHHKTGVKVGAIEPLAQIKRHCAEARKHGHDFCVVSSGRGMNDLQVKKIAQAVKACGGDMHASLGILSPDSFGILKKAGVTCYNHNLETSRRFFSKIVSTHTYDERVATVKAAKHAGLSVCCGGIFGVGESFQDRVDLALELKRLDVDSVPLNFFVHRPGVRTKTVKLSVYECLKTIILFRLILPDKIIKVCGGREVHLNRFQPLMFFAGANGYISGGYLTTGGDGFDSDDAMIAALNLVK